MQDIVYEKLVHEEEIQLAIKEAEPEDPEKTRRFYDLTSLQFAALRSNKTLYAPIGKDSPLMEEVED